MLGPRAGNRADYQVRFRVSFVFPFSIRLFTNVRADGSAYINRKHWLDDLDDEVDSESRLFSRVFLTGRNVLRARIID